MTRVLVAAHAGEWCIVVDAEAISPTRYVAHYFAELSTPGGALRLTAACGERFDFRRRPKTGEVAPRCELCIAREAPRG